jgi:hypothetical protein
MYDPIYPSTCMALASGCCDVMDELEFEVQIQNAFLVG